MTNPEFTVLIPHKRNKLNDRSLEIALSCLFTNSVYDFHLLMDAAYDEPLVPRINRLVQDCPTEIFVYSASDVYMAPGWDASMLDAWTPDTLVTGVLVEPGMIGMHHLNLKADFGRTPDTFRRQAFEDWTQDAPVPNGEGWYCPYMFSRTQFFANGGLETGLPGDYGFTNADIELFERFKANDGKVRRANSFAYHMQRWSDEGEQNKRERYE